MINLVVINSKTILKLILKLIAIIFIFFVSVKFVKIIYRFGKNFEMENFAFSANKIIGDNISISENFVDKEKNNSGFKKILVAELAVFAGAEEKKMEKENQEEVIVFENYFEQPKNEEVAQNTENVQIENNNVMTENVQTSVIHEKNKKDVYTDFYKTVQIKNESDYSLTENLVTPDINYSNTKDFIIYHTHTCESYTKSEGDEYTETGNYRTTDYRYSVVEVGQELSDYLAGKGYTVVHDKTYHDYPAYTGSYTRSLSTIKNLLSTYNSVDAVFDIHRDALGNNSDYAPCVKIGDEIVAQLMFVIGTDGGGLEHPNWNQNLKLAIKVQEKANEMYPGLFKPIILRNSRYNQHVTNGAAIIEVGATRKYFRTM